MQGLYEYRNWFGSGPRSVNLYSVTNIYISITRNRTCFANYNLADAPSPFERPVRSIFPSAVSQTQVSASTTHWVPVGSAATSWPSKTVSWQTITSDKDAHKLRVSLRAIEAGEYCFVYPKKGVIFTIFNFALPAATTHATHAPVTIFMCAHVT